MNLTREEALFAAALERSPVTRDSVLDCVPDASGTPLHVRQSKSVHVIGDAVPEHLQDRIDLIQAFPHPIPLDLKSVAVVDDVPEPAEGAKSAGQGLVEQEGQRGLRRWTEPLEQVQVPFSPAGSSTRWKRLRRLRMLSKPE